MQVDLVGLARATADIGELAFVDFTWATSDTPTREVEARSCENLAFGTVEAQPEVVAMMTAITAVTATWLERLNTRPPCGLLYSHFASTNSQEM
jgi:hypothetical protein